MAHSHCMLDNEGYTRIRNSNIYCFSSATVVKRMRLDVTLYVHCLSCMYLRTNNGYFLIEIDLLVFIDEV